MLTVDRIILCFDTSGRSDACLGPCQTSVTVFFCDFFVIFWKTVNYFAKVPTSNFNV